MGGIVPVLIYADIQNRGRTEREPGEQEIINGLDQHLRHKCKVLAISFELLTSP
jgi:hypothetical protein